MFLKKFSLRTKIFLLSVGSTLTIGIISLFIAYNSINKQQLILKNKLFYATEILMESLKEQVYDYYKELDFVSTILSMEKNLITQKH